MKYKHVFWDWNGTLLNDLRASFLAVDDMLVARNLPSITIEQYRDYIDIPIIRFYERVMDISKENLADLSVEFNKFYDSHLSESPLSEGAVDILNYLSDNGIKQYIFSSNSNALIKPYLEKFKISHFFEAVLGADDRNVDSKTERTLNYIRENHIPRDGILFVGDMVHDSDVADATGADCILLSVGHQSEDALLNSGRRVLPSFLSLMDIFNSF